MDRQAIVNAIHAETNSIDVTLVAVSGYCPAVVIKNVPVMCALASKMAIGSVVTATRAEYGRWYIVPISSGSSGVTATVNGLILGD